MNMATNDYHFATHWRVEGTAEEVFDILNNALELKRWWPSVYLDVKELAPGDARGIGRVVDLYTKGWLPYTLRWRFRITESNRPYRLALAAEGDFEGTGVWTLEQDGQFVNVIYDWNIMTNKPLLQSLSFILKPFFRLNHEWAMRKGYESLLLELARRHARTPEDRALIPAPPPPNFRSAAVIAAGSALVLLILTIALARRHPA